MPRKYLPITQARKELFQIAQEVQKPDIHYILTIEGKPELVLMSFEEYDSLLETVDFLSEPGALQELKTAEKEIEKGNVYDWNAVKTELEFARKGVMLVADAPKEKYQPKVRKRKKRD
ncbi:hypothetical protein COT20_00540 [bacterium (Candidatus Gribaldobacteria) CG08_land_8_20_14_0_20_39_15]|uniref:Antitoxin n=1 Tax=bacterium (Candidatus Gribaldobacteria) CG08_land_8_20_14_0_20_39_15 TaxID=2014273 RepID=A0A2M6XV48_9BACT|nr:MAG: hypothetical protein COT20_00540 [bacterium (Candidatus Gribaldobacteria) CG08_land_8_20_14_0_20_39_15]